MNSIQNALQNARWSEEMASPAIKRAIASMHDAIAELEDASFHFAEARNREELARVEARRKNLIEIIKTLSK